MNSSFAIRSSLMMALAGGMGVALAQRPVGLPDNYPNKPVRIIINNAPGGAGDITGRAVATLLSQRWGIPVIAVNIPGGDGMIGLATMTRAVPDGYTLMVASSGTYDTAVQVENVPYNVRTKFPPIALCIFSANIVAVNNDLPVRNLNELITYAKANPNKLNYAYSGQAPLVVGLLKIMTGIDMEAIPYKGMGPSFQDQMAGRINLTVGNTASAGALMRSGKIRAIAITSEKRNKAFPDLPTMRETLPTFDVFGAWLGIVGIEGMSAALINGLHREIIAVLGTPEADKMLNSASGTEIPLSSIEDFRKLIADALDSTARIVKQTGIKPG